MLQAGGDGQFNLLPGSAYPGHLPNAGAPDPSADTIREAKTKVLSHNPFSTMGTCSSSGSEYGTARRSGSAPLHQRLPVSFGMATSLYTNAPPAPSAAAATSPEKQLLERPPQIAAPSWQQRQQQQQRQEESCQRHQRPSLSLAENRFSFPQRVVESAGAASPFTTAQGAAPQDVAETTGPCLTPSEKVVRGLSLNSLSSAASGVERTLNESSVKRTLYLRSLLKKDPPDFLKPSSGPPVLRRSSAGPRRTPSPLDARLSRLKANGGLQVAQGLRPGSTGTNAEGEPQQLQKQPLQDPTSVPCPPKPNEGKQTLSPFVEASMSAEQQSSSNNNDANGSAVYIPLGSQSGLPRVLSTVAAPGPQFSSRGIGGSNTQLPSGSFETNTTEKSLHGSSVAEQKLLFHGVRPQDVNSGERFVPAIDVKPHVVLKEEKVLPFAPASRSGASETSGVVSVLGGVESPALPTKKTALTGEVPNLNFLPSNTSGMTRNLPPPPTALPPRPTLIGGEVAASLLTTASVLSKNCQELNTPRNGGMKLQKQVNPFQATQEIETAEFSPAPFRPSRQASEEVVFGADAAASGAGEATCIESFVTGDDNDVEPSLKARHSTLAFCHLPATVVRSDAAEFQAVAKEEEAVRCEQHQNTIVTSEGETHVEASVTQPPPLSRATRSALDSLEQQDIFNTKEGISRNVNESFSTRKRLPRERSSTKPCFALFTSTGHVLTVFNASCSGALTVVKSEPLANMLIGRVQNVKCFNVGEEYGNMLQLLAEFSPAFISSARNGVSLTMLRDVVAKMTGISLLLQEVLLFMLRDPPPEWRTEGQKSLIKILATAAARVSISDESRPNYPLNAEPPQHSVKDLASGLQKIQQLLCAGEREAAVGVALEHHLYSHAIIIAMMCPKKEHYMSVIRALVQQELDPFSPLAHAYCMFNELPLPPFEPEPTRPLSLSMPVASQCDAHAQIRSSWLQHAAVLVSNFTKESAEGLIQLGDSLVNAGMIDEAHCCFLLAHVSPMGTQPPGRPLQPKQQHIMELLRARLGVLGGRYNPQCSRSAFVSPKSTLLTDVLQFFRSHLESRSLASPEDSGKPAPQHGIPICPERYRAAFHYMQVLWLREVGLREEASQLMHELSRAVPSESKSGSTFTLNRLISSGVASHADAAGREQPASHAGGQASKRPMREERVSLPAPSLSFAAKGSIDSLTDRRPTFAPPPPSLQPQRQKQMMPQSPTPGPKLDVPLIPGPSKFHPQSVASAEPAIKGPPPPFSAQPTTTPSAVPPAMPPAEAPSGENNNATTDANETPAKLESSRSLQPQPQPQLQPRGRLAEEKGAREKPSQRSSSLEAITNFLFRRGRSQEAKKDEPKKMIIDTEKPPKFDPVTGRYLFEETEEEKKAAEMIRAGPPRPSAMAAKVPAVGGAVPSMMRPPTGPAGLPRAGPGTLPRAQYVDMFNST
ncbi:hypothetical protein TraAM80_04123 [Trypanosoma rangeli]|uniref:Sec16 Sec23-binding domain-containing protein n=1 Tax=Trypanosoma rangeli TaxID=5698 RepID=A0A3R7MPH7_TRYRA|nr:uncharacterized protein TraAM80_04123 [Trypanosoma rangeli]RNF06144.1 hypothetical protein TraAM80_04123 [Trypanosoma rangeli]|eukprot:RNF06144.1 hypothetical protein TraAM80_04123 [Trypanosoma rangeli]